MWLECITEIPMCKVKKMGLEIFFHFHPAQGTSGEPGFTSRQLYHFWDTANFPGNSWEFITTTPGSKQQDWSKWQKEKETFVMLKVISKRSRIQRC